MVVVFIILDWIFVSMNATAMWFPASMSHVKVFDLSIFSEEKMYQKLLTVF